MAKIPRSRRSRRRRRGRSYIPTPSPKLTLRYRFLSVTLKDKMRYIEIWDHADTPKDQDVIEFFVGYGLIVVTEDTDKPSLERFRDMYLKVFPVNLTELITVRVNVAD